MQDRIVKIVELLLIVIESPGSIALAIHFLLLFTIILVCRYLVVFFGLSRERHNNDVEDNDIGHYRRESANRLDLKRLKLEGKDDRVQQKAEKIDQANAHVPYHLVLIPRVNYVWCNYT